MTPTLAARLGVRHADRLFDADELSALLGRPVVVRHVRVKPGRGMLVAWARSEPVGDDGDHGWAMTASDPDKVAGLLRRAARATGDVHEHGEGLFSGDVSTDPRLATPVRHATGGRPVHRVGGVLRYNPGRRLILTAEDTAGPVVLRIAARSLTGLIATGRRWADAGVPTLPHRPWRTRPTAAAADRWGRGDLAGDPSLDAAHATGRALARLHALPLDTAFGADAHTAGGRSDAPAIASVTELLPELTAEASALQAALRSLPRTPAVPCHGDLSPDQVLQDGTDIRIVDLDRATPGPPGLDLGTWLAWCRLNDAADLADAFLAGYRSLAALPDLRPWVARALLACAIDPFRHGRPGWPTEVEARVRAASVVASRPEKKEIP